MNSEEYGCWLVDLKLRYPSLMEMIVQHMPTVDLWYRELLHDLEIEDCLEGNRQLLNSFQNLNRWDFDKIGPEIRRIAKRLEWEREELVRSREGYRPPMRGGSGMAATLAAVLTAETDEQRQSLLQNAFPLTAKEDIRQPRYRCLACTDTGLVRIYEQDSVKSAWKFLHRRQDGPASLQEVKVMTAMVACTCGAGVRHVEGSKRPLTLLEDRHYRCSEVLPSKQRHELCRHAERFNSLIESARQKMREEEFIP